MFCTFEKKICIFKTGHISFENTYKIDAVDDEDDYTNLIRYADAFC